MSISQSASIISDIARAFAHSAEHEFRNASPLYERLATGVSKDRELLALAAHAISKPVPMIFFAAVHYLLLNGEAHPLAAYFPDITAARNAPDVPDGDPYDIFREFCLDHRTELERIISTYHVQTNEVRRCACLLPAFAMVSAQTKGLPLALVEIGASAGLNLLWDHYGYDFGNGIFCGDRASSVQMTCTLKGDGKPPFPATLPQIASRWGLDFHPIDVRDLSATNWLRAFIWPEQKARFDLLSRAIEVARCHPPQLLAGDALDLLPTVISATPPEHALCLFHTFVSNQMSEEGRDRLACLIAGGGRERDISCISIDFSEGYPRLDLLSYKDGVKTHRRLANCSGHSRWLEWLDRGNEEK